MRDRSRLALAALLTLLAGCGPSERETTIASMCERRGGRIPDIGRVDCDCTARLIEQSLSEPSNPDGPPPLPLADRIAAECGPGAGD